MKKIISKFVNKCKGITIKEDPFYKQVRIAEHIKSLCVEGNYERGVKYFNIICYHSDKDTTMFENFDKQMQLQGLVNKVANVCGYERGAVCAVDCILQWKEGWFRETAMAWENYCEEFIKNGKNGGYVTCNRHGAWVPAIPM